MAEQINCTHMPLSITDTLLSISISNNENANDVAVTYDDEFNNSISHTYGMIEEISNALQEELIQIAYSNGISSSPNKQLSGGVIMVYGEESIWLPTILLGILKTNSAFFPCGVISPGCDEMRLRSLSSVGICGIIIPKHCTKAELEILKSLYDTKNDYVRLQSVDEEYVFIAIHSKCCHTLLAIEKPLCNDLAFIALTSGSTGPPKVVKVPHSCIVPNVKDLSELFAASHDDVVLLPSALTFDAAIVQLFVSLRSGCRLLIVPNSVRRKAATLILILVKQKATILQVTPSLISRLPGNELQKTLFSASSSVRILALGGECFPHLSLLRQWFNPNCKLELFNLYGITEVSSWATCKKVEWEDIKIKDIADDPYGKNNLTANTPTQFTDVVSIGLCLSQTEIILKNEGANNEMINGYLLKQIFVGSKNRYCYIDGDDENISYMRNTGDLGVEINGEIFVTGRKDDQVKRNGIRFNLNIINSLISALEQVTCSHALMTQNSLSEELVVFIQEASSKESHIDSTAPMLYAPTETMKEIVTQCINKELAHYCLPDRIISINFFPITTHGKLDKNIILQMYDRFYNNEKNDIVLNSKTLKSFVIDSWTNCLNAKSEIDSKMNFIRAGGTSLDCVKLCNKLENYILLRRRKSLGINYNDLMATIMERSLEELIDTMEFACGTETGLPIQTTDNNADEDSATSRKRTRSVLGDIESPTSTLDSPCRKSISVASSLSVDCCLDWKVNLGACIDGSPIIDLNSNRRNIYIGSHAGLFSKIDASNGAIKWETNVGNRIEGSATLTLDENFVVFGCHDNYIYILKTNDGVIYWSVKTEGLIKSKPALNSSSGLMYISSYDHHLYCLDIPNKRIMWKLLIGNSSCHGGPVVLEENDMLIVALLGGGVYSICLKTNQISWQKQIGKPIFSTPCILPNKGICFGCVDGYLRLLDFNGDLLWAFNSYAPIFSSPLFVCNDEDNQGGTILFGNHGSRCICLSLDGILQWDFDTDSNIYSKIMSFTFEVTTIDTEPVTSNLLHLGTCCSTKGTVYVLNLANGNVLCSYYLPGMVFSSPVYTGQGSLIVGSRDDHLYSIKMDLKDGSICFS